MSRSKMAEGSALFLASSTRLGSSVHDTKIYAYLETTARRMSVAVHHQVVVIRLPAVAFHAGWPLVDLIDALASNAINYTRSSDGYVLVSPLYGNELARLQRETVPDWTRQNDFDCWSYTPIGFFRVCMPHTDEPIGWVC
jgi:hypothetical protein